MNIKKGDTVLIISGKDRGRKAKVFEVFPEKNRILAEGINIRKKHQKPKKSGEKGQIVEMPGSIPASNVKLICPKCGKAVKVGYRKKTKNQKQKIRICKKCGQEIL